MDNTTTQNDAANGQLDQTSSPQGFAGEPIKKIVTTAAANETTTAPTEGQAPALQGDQAQAAVVATETQPAPDFLKKFREAGYDVDSEERILEMLNSGREYQSKLTEYESKLKEFDSIDPLARDIDRAKRAGMDINLYWNARNMDVAKFSPKEALKNKFILENAEMAASNPEFINKKFERDYQARFGILDKKFDDEVEQAEKQEEVEFAKLSLEAESSQARNFLTDWKNKNVTIPEATQSENPNAISREESERIVHEYNNQAQAFVDELDVMEIPIDGNVFNYGLEDIRDSIKEQLANPVETLIEYGVDLNTGRIDPEKVGRMLLLDHVLSNIKPLVDYAIEKRNAELVTTKAQGSAPSQSLSGGTPGRQLTEIEKVGQAFAAKRQAERAANNY